MLFLIVIVGVDVCVLLFFFLWDLVQIIEMLLSGFRASMSGFSEKYFKC